MAEFKQSHKLHNVLYDIRGPLLQHAQQMEAAGHRILKLNIGNPAPFGFEAPEAILVDMMRHLPTAQGYSDSRGIFSARTAVVQYYQGRGINNIDVDDVYLGNGVSELITLSLQALLNNGDEILVPAPDYPLWTASVSLAGGTAVHYMCDEAGNWWPDVDDIAAKITDRTKGIVLINPNNPTGAVYPEHVVKSIVELARKHGLIIFSDEIYEKIVYDDAVHVNSAALTGDDVLCLTFSGLSKAYRIAGYRSGWMAISGPKRDAADYIEGINLLANMRLCANVPAQHAIQTALGGYQSINDLILPGGRLRAQRDKAYQMLNDIPGVSCEPAQGALYLFPRLDPDVYPIKDDEQFALDLLKQQKILISVGTAFNWVRPDHFRMVFLPSVEDIEDAMTRLAEFLGSYKP
ncbi:MULTISPECIES: pyridoxal phosphate-dependent aminotransferase [unclassified Arthrobacter]|uniref:pyridoxal phosphate-dependent aminotransferase n=1 Tax=unclassified Arthrobacter TaxID=235627 RepID=UPI001D14B393|nr:MULTISPECIES: pyridoxal phosphate-dependent aminotransferase [unclassified Arthrobacter]MCC3276171.1 pyridoxal phosphate-dependent aminotransferase [Arthrobacter sp. zg-Y20]MCC3277847.1 pyridoxal phosphate-dependent aminotransferase [Arthrobacter sp. zg-Y40]MCC9176243.1 pyridoxal phosphate-dependent aminotransferase [Arthrobacter sp. zg-Y750]MDK1316331.1 pyridoxal phosphate-dependent aminotransferase [Arthrobacter sp. zg.Y20]MDK1327057.1 pyridoxal phosphate-dependent aminotransferase [Arthr